jgi:hypothetical protein
MNAKPYFMGVRDHLRSETTFKLLKRKCPRYSLRKRLVDLRVVLGLKVTLKSDVALHAFSEYDNVTYLIARYVTFLIPLAVLKLFFISEF